MNERFKMIRKALNLTQNEMAEKIGLTSATISRMEKAVNAITEQTIMILCNEFNINENWLRTGIGEMFIIPEEDELLGEALAIISLSENEKLKKVVQDLIKLDEKAVDLINDLIDFILSSKNVDGE